MNDRIQKFSILSMCVIFLGGEGGKRVAKALWC